MPVDRLRVDRLVGRDEHEAPRAELDRRLRDDARGEDVVPDRLERVRLQQRDVLVRSRVEDDRGLVALEDLAHLRPALAVAEHRHRRCEAALVHELALDLEQARLPLLDEHEPLGAEPCDLAAELRADRAAGACHQHCLVAHIRGACLLYRADLPGEVALAGDQLIEAWQRLDRDVALARHVHDPLAHLAGRGRDRDQHLVGLVVAEDPRQVGGRSEHTDAVDTQVPLARVVVDQADRRVAELPVALELPDHELARVAGARDEHLLAPRDQGRSRPLDQRTREQARARDEPEEEQPVEDRDRPR